jgi:succinate dehydrogenase / fumarate reductase membrane anchor subunit
MGTGTSIGRVRGLGAAKEGTHHWWRQRLTAGLNIALMSWLLLSLARLTGYDLASVRLWIGSPWVAIPLALLVGQRLLPLPPRPAGRDRGLSA